MYIIYISVLVYSIFRTIRGLLRIISTFNWINFEERKIKPTDKQGEYTFVILIPVLREQAVIRKNFHIFSNLEDNYKLVYITTEKENYQEKEIEVELLKKLDALAGLSSKGKWMEWCSGIFPKDVAANLFVKTRLFKNLEEKKQAIITEYKNKKYTKQIIRELIIETRNKNVEIIHFPEIDGVMAHQLNYACKKLLDRYDPSKTFVLIYNADSCVSPQLILYINGFLQNNPKIKIIQQSALFLDNFNQFSGWLRKHFLQSIALLQSRWTLAHELPRLIGQSTSKISNYTEGAHVVGHGLCIRLDALDKVGLFPTSSINEDLLLGYLLRLSGETIYPLPLLESAESPTTIKSMFNQYKTWFYGNAFYSQYLLHALRHKYPKVRAFLWAFRYTSRAIIWLLTSFVWLFLLIYPLVTGKHWLLWVAITTFTVYAPLSFFMIQYNINKKGSELFRLDVAKININPITYIMSLPAYLTHSIGPLWASWNIIMSVLFRRDIKKQKTER